MGRLSGIFSRSSGKDSNVSSDIGRAWTLLSRSQSMTAQSPQRNAAVLREISSNELNPSKPSRNPNQQHLTVCESPEECEQRSALPLLPQSNPHAHPISSGSEVLVSLDSTPTSGYTSRRLGGIKTLFRPRRYRLRRIEIDLPEEEQSDDACEFERPLGPAPTPENGDDSFVEGNKAPTSPSKSQLVSDIDARKVSDTTDKSVNSNNTSITVHRRPSKRMSMPITVVDREGNHPNPFGDILEGSHSERTGSNPFTEPSRMTETIRQSSSTFGSSENPFSSYPGHIFELSSSSSHSSWCYPAISGLNSWPTPADRRLATDSFNKLVSELYLDPLAIHSDNSVQNLAEGNGYWKHQSPSRSPNRVAEERALAAAEKLQRRRDRLIGRIRTMRSTIQIRSEPTLTRARSLRRMKTFSALPYQPCLMASLRGKPLETLARLGGYGLLTLPGDFAPTTLSLPVCFVAVITYLRCFAPPVPHLFVDPGDVETATQTYEYFANQVLSAEKEKSKIHMTMRSSKMPSFLEEGFQPGMEGRSPMQVLSVAFTFKHLLAGLPGGLLGSIQLYRVLVNICYGRVSQGPAQRTGSCLAGLSPEDYAKARAISLAILALTSSMQLNLICGVFGLCTLLLHETERISELDRRQGRRSSRRVSGCIADRLSKDRLAATLGPLLTETSRLGGPDTFHAIQEEIESQRVVGLLIGNWRSISRQLRIWERRGLDGRVHVSPARAASSENAEVKGT
ncbi:hypothetical protein BJX68DRAFT_98648 [Aspergillus pseudodeflectus]|uniref:Uncharacterized protein n=1 Tax=Aspergillus pseudodeflectus TaxID=176178 RepID=A0ABR4K9V0_9EURO